MSRFFCSAWVSLAALLACAPALAQSVEDEIIVTATKRARMPEPVRAQDLPMALDVFSAQALDAQAVEDLTSLSFAMPNVQLEDIGTGRGVANLAIRGIGVNSSISSVDPAVAIVVDGMALGMNAGAITDLFDLEAVEVLRGPQGALYGRNATGGAVLVRTKGPSEQFEAGTRLAAETGSNLLWQAHVSGPLGSDRLLARLAVLHTDDDGWFNNRLDGGPLGANQTSAARVSLQWLALTDLTFNLRLEHGEAQGDGPVSQNHALWSREGFDVAIDNIGHAFTDWDQAILQSDWRVGWGNGTLTAVTGWRKSAMGWGADIDSTPAFAFHTRILNLHEQISQEVRYAGTLGAVDLTGGVFVLHQRLTYFDERNFPGVARRVGGGKGDFSTQAIFAHADWNLRAGLIASAGLRLTREQKKSAISRVRRASDDLNGPAILIAGEGQTGGDLDARTLVFSDTPFDQTWEDASPRLGLQWRPDAATNLYASWARAQRSGGANFRTSTLGLAPRAYDAETVQTLELGWKQDWLRDRLRVNLAVFRNDIRDMQRETNQADPISGVQQIVLNAGDAVIHGAEAQARWQISPRVTLGGHVGWLDGRYTSVSEDLNGDRLVNGADLALQIPRLAPWSYGLDLSWNHNALGGLWQTRLAWQHRDAAFYSDNNLGRLPRADRINAMVDYAPAHGGWGVRLYGENLLDQASWGGDTVLPDIASFGGDGASGPRGLPTFSPLNKGRVLGLELRAAY